MKNDDFNSLKADWSRTVAPPSQAWVSEIQKLDRHWKRARVIGTVSLSLTVGFFLWYLINLTPTTWYGLTGILVIMGDILLYLGFLWRKRNDTGADVTLVPAEFAAQFERVIMNRLWLIRRVLPWYMVSLLLGINLTYLEVLARGSVAFRLALHVLVTLGLSIAGRLLYHFQLRKIEKKTAPALEALRSVIQSNL
jgi:hypothetical protein